MKQILLYVPVLLLAACSQSEKFSEITINEQYALSLPESMIPAHFDDLGSLQYKDSVRELYVEVIDESRKTIADHGLVYDLPLYTRIAMRNADSTLADTTRFKPEPITVNGFKALHTTINRRISPKGKAAQDAVYDLTVIETPGHFYQLEIWTMKSWADRNKSTIEKIRSSFKTVTPSTDTVPPKS